MPRNMSCAMTTDQVRAKTKDLTRRFGWWFLKAGDVVNLVEKSMGLKPGQKVKHLAQVRIVSTRPEPLNAITQSDVTREGFPDWTPAQFVQMLVDHYGVDPKETVNRIEFQYLFSVPSGWTKGERVKCAETVISGRAAWVVRHVPDFDPRKPITQDAIAFIWFYTKDELSDFLKWWGYENG